MGVQGRLDAEGAVEIDLASAIAGVRGTPETVRRLARSFQLAQEVGRIGCYEIDMVTGIAHATAGFFEHYGLPGDRLRITPAEWRSHVHPEDWPAVKAQLDAALAGQEICAFEHRILTTTGETRWVASRCRVDRDETGAAILAYGIQQDITDRRAAESRALWIATHDPLTGLANRVVLLEELEQRCRAAAPERAAELLLVDLDRFKPVNDTHGHPLGDALLRLVAGRLTAAAPAGALVARMGGDEFAVLVPAGADGRAVAAQLTGLLGRPFLLQGHVITIGASAGLAAAPRDAGNAEGLIRAADLALYSAKAAGRDCWRAYDAGMDSAARDRMDMVDDLRRAVAVGALELHYQPQIDLATNRVVGFEALLRWRRPGHGLVPPDRFIPLAEETGLIGPIGEWVLHAATREAAGWPEGLRVAVNLSPRQLELEDKLVASVRHALKASGLAPARLELEVTETGLARAGREALAQLHRLRALGVRISIDDFGTGHSSLSRLLDFPFDNIKVDRNFVGGLGRDEKAGALVRSIAALARSLGVRSVAEGVETHEQATLVRHDGFTEIQGYLVSRPMPAAEIAAFLSSRGAHTMESEPCRRSLTA